MVLQKQHKFSYILPVLFYEYLAISIARSLIPGMILKDFGGWSYAVVGIMETVKGILAFISCPLFGKLSDRIGRRYCLLVTVTGTTLPVWVMAFTTNMWAYTVCMGISGFFTATFPLTFAYISDCVDKNDRAPAFGLALATFGLSFSLGPVAGAFLHSNMATTGVSVFFVSLFLVVIDVLYILFVLPETAPALHREKPPPFTLSQLFDPAQFNFRETFRVFRGSAFMTNVAIIVFLYYSSVWAVVSTLMIHVTRQLHFSAGNVAWLLTGYGVCTMFSEAVVVRVVVPALGETLSMRIGLAAFAVQATCIAFSVTPMVLFASMGFSILSNLVYPAVSSLVSKVVNEQSQGEALGALNGIKALTEGFGPLTFGAVMQIYEDTPTPGAPYVLAAVVAAWAFLHSYKLPLQTDIAHLRHLHESQDEADGLLVPSLEDDA